MIFSVTVVPSVEIRTIYIPFLKVEISMGSFEETASIVVVNLPLKSKIRTVATLLVGSEM